MLSRWLCKQHVFLRGVKSLKGVSLKSHRSYAQDTENAAKAALSRTRNIGIIAHIDAGKTTTTERMLYYSGFTRRIGDVDEGSTVTDFLPAERARGITIQSAAISFSWPPSVGAESSPTHSPGTPRSLIPHNINLIDTPGHADFTFEVLRSLRVLDGAVCILDGVAGVEAQTEKVWAQASAYAIPRVIFVNKLDRDGATFSRTVKEVGARLGVWPAVCGIPWWNAAGNLQGVGDVVNLRGLKYPEGGDGKDIDAFGLEQLQQDDEKLAISLKEARIALVELLSEHDEEMVERYLEADEDHLAIPAADIIESLRRCVLRSPQAIAPVYAGASFRNIGVQPLLDAVVDLLPSPDERPDPEISLHGHRKAGLDEFLSGRLAISTSPRTGKSLSKEKANLSLQNLDACALAFKVVADPRRGVLVYVRVYSGSLQRNSALWNTNLQMMERAQKLLKMYANDAVDIDAIPAGQIGVIPSLKAARTGDTLISYTGANPKTGPPAPVNTMQLRPIEIPPPVFFVSVEPNSLAEEKHIKESLELLLREDPSLHVSLDEESGQTHLSGMGELHLEIARDRLVNDLKAKARIGKIEIGYREAITTASDALTEVLDREVGGKSSKAGCTASVQPSADAGDISGNDDSHNFRLSDGNQLTILTPTLHPDGTPKDPETPGFPSTLEIQAATRALQTGVNAALARGPTHTYPVHSTSVTITLDPASHIFSNTTPAALSSAARLAVQTALKQSAQISESVLMEPVMLVTISVDESSMGGVVHDLSSARGGSVVSLDSTSDGAAESQTMVDVRRIYAPPDPFAGSSEEVGTGGGATNMRQIVARVPLKEMVGYLKHLRSLTAGRGTFTMVVDRFEKMSAQRQKAVIGEMRGDGY